METRTTAQDHLVSSDNAFITLSNLNKVYKDIRTRYDSISGMYTVKGNKNWSEILKLSGDAVALGDVYTVKGKSPTQKPESIQNNDNIVCIKAIPRGTVLDDNTWYEYWREIGGVFGAASTEESGLVTASAQTFGGSKTFTRGVDKTNVALTVEDNSISTVITPDSISVGKSATPANTYTGTLNLYGDSQATIKSTSSLGILLADNKTHIKELAAKDSTLKLAGSSSASISTSSNLGELHTNHTNINSINSSSDNPKVGTLTIGESVSAGITGTSNDLGTLQVTNTYIGSINSSKSSLSELVGTLNTSKDITISGTGSKIGTLYAYNAYIKNLNDATTGLSSNKGTLKVTNSTDAITISNTGNKIGTLYAESAYIKNLNDTVSDLDKAIGILRVAAINDKITITGANNKIGTLHAKEAYIKLLNESTDTTTKGTIKTSNDISITSTGSEIGTLKTGAAYIANINSDTTTKTGTLNTGSYTISIKSTGSEIGTLKATNAYLANINSSEDSVKKGTLDTGNQTISIKNTGSEIGTLKTTNAYIANINSSTDAVKKGTISTSAAITVNTEAIIGTLDASSVSISSLSATGSTLTVNSNSNISATTIKNVSSLSANSLDINRFVGTNTDIEFSTSGGSLVLKNLKIKGADGNRKIELDGTNGDIYAKTFNVDIGNDYVDRLPSNTVLEPGYCYAGVNGDFKKTAKYGQKNAVGIHSDTSSMFIGSNRETTNINIAVAGFVLAYLDKEYPAGTPLTCTKDGKLTKAKLFTRLFHPERIYATFYKTETAEFWGSEAHKVSVSGRHWVKIK